jgi:small conductance mechanosensitive channel
MDWNKIWTSITSFFTNNFWNIVIWFAVLFIGIIVVKIMLNIIRKIMNKTKMEKVTQSFLYNIVKFLFYLVLILILLNMIGVEMTGILTTISALLLAVGMALQSNISNLANGIVLVTTHLVKKGDFISVNGVDGSVEDINFLFTTIMTTDNKKITIPNSDLVNNPVTNYGANKTRRVDFTFGVAYESDTELVKKIILDVMHSNGKVLLEPKAPFCKLKTLNASSIDFFANCWVDNEDYWDVYYYIIEHVYNEFKRNDISIPYNQIEVRERKDTVKMPVIKDKLPERVEKERHMVKHHIDLEKDSLLALFKHKNKEGKEKKPKKEKNKNVQKDKQDEIK